MILMGSPRYRLGVNFLCTFIPLYLIERLGRRVLLLVSIVGYALTSLCTLSNFSVIASLCMMGGAFLLINHASAPVASSADMSWGNDHAPFNSSATNADHCKTSYTNCDFCVTDERYIIYVDMSLIFVIGVDFVESRMTMQGLVFVYPSTMITMKNRQQVGVSLSVTSVNFDSFRLLCYKRK